MSNSPFCRIGFTLIEVLVVVAILAILMGVLTVGVNAATREARVISDTSKLRQIGLSNVVYAADFDDKMSFSVVQLVNTGHLARELAASENDSSKLGLANELMQNRHKPIPASKVSFLSFSDPGSDQSPEPYNLNGNVGWAAALIPPFTDFEENGTHFVLPGEAFLRLRLDGGVVRKRTVWTQDDHDGIHSRSFNFQTLFID